MEAGRKLYDYKRRMKELKRRNRELEKRLADLQRIEQANVSVAPPEEAFYSDQCASAFHEQVDVGIAPPEEGFSAEQNEIGADMQELEEAPPAEASMREPDINEETGPPRTDIACTLPTAPIRPVISRMSMLLPVFDPPVCRRTGQPMSIDEWRKDRRLFKPTNDMLSRFKQFVRNTHAYLIRGPHIVMFKTDGCKKLNYIEERYMAPAANLLCAASDSQQSESCLDSFVTSVFSLHYMGKGLVLDEYDTKMLIKNYCIDEPRDATWCYLIPSVGNVTEFCRVMGYGESNSP